MKRLSKKSINFSWGGSLLCDSQDSHIEQLQRDLRGWTFQFTAIKFQDKTQPWMPGDTFQFCLTRFPRRLALFVWQPRLISATATLCISVDPLIMLSCFSVCPTMISLDAAKQYPFLKSLALRSFMSATACPHFKICRARDPTARFCAPSPRS